MYDPSRHNNVSYFFLFLWFYCHWDSNTQLGIKAMKYHGKDFWSSPKAGITLWIKEVKQYNACNNRPVTGLKKQNSYEDENMDSAATAGMTWYGIAWPFLWHHMALTFPISKLLYIYDPVELNTTREATSYAATRYFICTYLECPNPPAGGPPIVVWPRMILQYNRI
jgi:hypothetical protein